MFVGHRLKNFEIRISNHSHPEKLSLNSMCHTQADNISTGGVLFECDQPITGRFITVQIMGIEKLTICELQAEGTGSIFSFAQI